MESDISILIVLILLSSIFSGGEVAFISLSSAKVRSLVETKHRSYKAIHKLKSNPQRLLVTILIGNNLVNIAAPVVLAAYTIRVFGSEVLAIATAIIFFLIILFGEIIPKSFAQKHAVLIASILAWPFFYLQIILFPLILFFEVIIKIFMAFGGNKKIKSVTEEELLAMVDIGKEEGTLEAHEQRFITNILEFSDTQVEEVMTPRLKMKTLESNTPVKDALKTFVKASHSRIPVYDIEIDNIIGVLTIKNIFKQYNSGNQSTPIKDLELVPAIIVPQTKAIKSLFNDFKRKRIHMAIVVDELGGVVGLVTMEDLLEEIVGEIEDEEDVQETLIKKMGNNVWLVEGRTPIEVITEQTQIEFSEDVPVHKPISLMILNILERFPKEGEKIELPNLIMRVEKMGEKRIEKIRIIKKEPQEEEEEN